MGTYSELYYGNQEVACWRSEIPSFLPELSKSDFNLSFEPFPFDEHHNQAMLRQMYSYRTTAKIAAERMDAQGITLERAKKALETSKREAVYDAVGPFWRSKATRPSAYADYDVAFAIECLEEVTWERWAREILSFLRGMAEAHEQPRTRKQRITNFLLDRTETYFGFRYDRNELARRALLSLLPDDEVVSLDCTDIVEGGYVDRLDLEDPPPIALLTEGTSDREIIGYAMKRYAPHLAHLFSFLELDKVGLAGGAPGVVNFVKVLAGARVRDKFLAILDNDSSAHEASFGLASKLPSNIGLMHLPEIEIAAAYPCTGPNGEHEYNINGFAVSIEHFGGRECLEFNGQMAPVQWSTLLKTVQKYQGEIVNKREVLDRFRNAVRDGGSPGEIELKVLVQAIAATAANLQ